MDVGLMVEGQNGLNWESWRRILVMSERLGFPTLFRSDHFFMLPTHQQDSLDPYLSFTLAASETTQIRFGPLVTPITFRHPANLGRMAAQIDLLSGGRFVLGIGAGWNMGEHAAYGLDFPETKERFDRLTEALEMMRALWSDGPASYDGKYYQLDNADCLPKPESGRPPIMIGGSGEKRTLRLVAEFADEWNTPAMPVEDYRHKCQILEQHCEVVGRDPASIRRSMMSFGLVGPNEATIEGIRDVLEDKGLGRGGAGPAATVGGTTDEVVNILGQLAELGLDEIEFQHFDFNSDEVPEYLAAEIVGHARDL
ncbi:MAG TPA: LLM class F420-dependent oxidoreductase [Dehalococcoidia bacterium]|nr:LLM class F420-dependent oxidoreductase [Dehalococcoidia bacterium]|tara:strand:+ start:4427 stop:5359 length:933 start_codon:yes stop_codon:yes gene_type:complete